jgi:hypothetical protein
MVLSDKELAVLQSVADGVKNTTGYGYQVMVHGTVVDGAVGLICTAIAVVITAYGASKMFAWARSIKSNPDEYEDGHANALAVAIIGTVILFILASIATYIGLHGSLMNMFAPEYQVVNHIIASATAK